MLILSFHADIEYLRKKATGIFCRK